MSDTQPDNARAAGPRPSPRRACIKLAVLSLAILALIGGLALSIDERALDLLKHSLTLWSLIAVLLIINLVLFLAFMLLYVAYQWVRKDIKPESANEDLPPAGDDGGNPEADTFRDEERERD